MRRSIEALVLTVLLGTGCGAFGPAPAPTSAPRAKPVYAVWEFDTLAELDQLLDIKGCEGWRLAEAMTRGDKLIAIIVRDGPAPPPDPACRPATP